MTVVFKNHEDKPIEDWQNWTRPKREYQWKEGRSAMELARSWFPSGTLQCPSELQNLLSTNARTADTQFDEGRPEFVTSLPQRGEGRNHDLC